MDPIMNGGDDTLNGTVGADLLQGGAGNDRLSGGQGSDTLDGGEGNDVLRGGEGNDVALGGAGNDDLGGGNGEDTLDGGEGNDSLYGGAGNDNLQGGVGDDRLSGDAGNDSIGAGVGNDTVFGGEGKDTLLGGAGDDVIYGGVDDDLIRGQAGADRIFGEDGNDNINAGADNDLVDGGLGNDILFGDLGNDTILGGAGNDLIDGGAGDDKIDGGADDDRINGGEGKDTIIGGTGTDRVTFSATGSLGPELVMNGDFSMVGTKFDPFFGFSFTPTGWDVTFGEASAEFDLPEYSVQIFPFFGDPFMLFGELGTGLGDLSQNLNTEAGQTYQFSFNMGSYSYGATEPQSIQVDILGQDDKVIASHIFTDDTPAFFGSIEPDADTLKSFSFKADGPVRLKISNLNGPAESLDSIFNGVDAYFDNVSVRTIPSLDADVIRLGSELNDSVIFTDISSELQVLVTVNTGAVGDGMENSMDSLPAVKLQLQESGAIEGKTFGDVARVDDEGTLLSGTKFNVTESSGHFVGLFDEVQFGTGGSDTLNFTTFGDRFVVASLGDDNVRTAAGNDFILGGEGNNKLSAGEGNDTLIAESGLDTIYGGAGNDEIEGGAGANQLFGEDGHDFINSGDDNDLVDGGQGDDTLFVGNGNNTVAGGDGFDFIISGDDNDLVEGGQGDDNLYVGNGNNTVAGGDGNDFINSGEGDDLIDGGQGDDTLFAGKGKDMITGGTGHDRVFVSATQGKELVVNGDFSTIRAFGSDFLPPDNFPANWDITTGEGIPGFIRPDFSVLRLPFFNNGYLAFGADGTGFGDISQSLNTDAGQTYQLSFKIGSKGNNSPQSVQVDILGQNDTVIASHTYQDSTGSTNPLVEAENLKSFSFQADGPVRLKFSNLLGPDRFSGADMYIDDVSVRTAPTLDADVITLGSELNDAVIFTDVSSESQVLVTLATNDVGNGLENSQDSLPAVQLQLQQSGAIVGDKFGSVARVDDEGTLLSGTSFNVTESSGQSLGLFDEVQLGTSAGDTLSFAAKGDRFVAAGEGDDDVSTSAGNDYLLGGNGNDTLSGGNGVDTIFGGSGVDKVILSTSPQGANFVLNGDFSMVGTYIVPGLGPDFSVGTWDVTLGVATAGTDIPEVSVLRYPFNNGYLSLGAGGTGFGEISQNLNTVAGQTYEFSFNVGSFGDNSLQSIQVDILGENDTVIASHVYEDNTGSQSPLLEADSLKSFSFKADGPVRLKISNLIGPDRFSSADMYFDNVSVKALALDADVIRLGSELNDAVVFTDIPSENQVLVTLDTNDVGNGFEDSMDSLPAVQLQLQPAASIEGNKLAEAARVDDEGTLLSGSRFNVTESYGQSLGLFDEVQLGTSASDILSFTTEGDRFVAAGQGDDNVSTGAGNDYLLGGEGNDTLSGGAGNDKLAGGLGADTFVYATGIDGTDSIKDFAVGDAYDTDFETTSGGFSFRVYDGQVTGAVQQAGEDVIIVKTDYSAVTDFNDFGSVLNVAENSGDILLQSVGEKILFVAYDTGTSTSYLYEAVDTDNGVLDATDFVQLTSVIQDYELVQGDIV